MWWLIFAAMCVFLTAPANAVDVVLGGRVLQTSAHGEVYRYSYAFTLAMCQREHSVVAFVDFVEERKLPDVTTINTLLQFARVQFSRRVVSRWFLSASDGCKKHLTARLLYR